MGMSDNEYIEHVADEVMLYEREMRDGKNRLQSEREALAEDLSGQGGDDMLLRLAEMERDATRRKKRLKWRLGTFFSRLKIMFG